MRLRLTVTMGFGLIALYLIAVVMFIAWEWSRSPSVPEHSRSQRRDGSAHMPPSERERRKAA